LAQRTEKTREQKFASEQERKGGSPLGEQEWEGNSPYEWAVVPKEHICGRNRKYE